MAFSVAPGRSLKVRPLFFAHASSRFQRSFIHRIVACRASDGKVSRACSTRSARKLTFASPKTLFRVGIGLMGGSFALGLLVVFLDCR